MIIKRDPAIIQGYFEDTSNLQGGTAEAVMIPETEAELSDLVRESNKIKTPMTISGGGTGTTGSRIPFGGIVISLEKFTALKDVSAERMTCTAESAVLVDEVKAACEEKGLFYTSHPTEESATVGGTIATNASGSRSFKYGAVRQSVKRLSLVLPTGETMTVRRGERILKPGDMTVAVPGGRRVTIPSVAYRVPAGKNAAGYFMKDGMDLIDLFIGQEGTLAIITGAEMEVVKRPERIFSAFVFFKSLADAWAFAYEARDLSKGSPVAGAGIDALSIEYMDPGALELLSRKGHAVPAGSKAAIFFEQEATAGTEGAIAEAWLGLMEKHHAAADDTWVAMTEAEAARFTAFRHAVPEAVNEIIRHRGIPKLSTDIAVPDERADEMMRFYVDLLDRSGLENLIFGHIGENHVHVNILPRSPDELARGTELICACIDKGVSCGGTVSAEHGIGKVKRAYLERMYGPEGIRDMARIKKAFDPNCLLGLDTLFPREVLQTI